jgi:hypothetical protein
LLYDHFGVRLSIVKTAAARNPETQ